MSIDSLEPKPKLQDGNSTEAPTGISAKTILDNTEQGMQSLIFFQYLVGLLGVLALPLYALGELGTVINGFIGVASLVLLALCFIRSSEAGTSITKTHFHNIKFVFWVILAFLLLSAVTTMGYMSRSDSDEASEKFFATLTVLLACGLLWYSYRYLKGLVRLKDGRDYV